MDEIEFFTSRAHRSVPRRTRAIKTTAPAATQMKRGSAWGHTHTGYREDLKMTMRSGWESNIARTFKAYDIPFQFEPMVFTFPIKRGTKGYIPDFYLPDEEEWVEVKGYFDNKSRIKIKRFKKYYPDEFAQLTMIVGNSKASLAICEELEIPRVLLYPKIMAEYKPLITGWEG